MAGGGDGHVAALEQHVGLADDKGLVGRGEVGHLGASEAKINRAVVVGNGNSRSLRLVVVGGNDDGHARKHLHQPNVFKNLVRRAVFAQGKARVGSTDFDVLVRVGNALPNLIINAPGREVGKGAGERNPSPDGQARCHAHHVCLGNACLKEALWEFLGKGVHFKRASEVGAKGNDLGVAASEFKQAGAKTAPGILASLVNVGVHR